LDRIQPLAFVQAPEDHRCLNRAKQEQRAGSGRKIDVCK
jgi:hypothetical protein